MLPLEIGTHGSIFAGQGIYWRRHHQMSYSCLTAVMPLALPSGHLGKNLLLPVLSNRSPELQAINRSQQHWCKSCNMLRLPESILAQLCCFQSFYKSHSMEVSCILHCMLKCHLKLE